MQTLVPALVAGVAFGGLAVAIRLGLQRRRDPEAAAVVIVTYATALAGLVALLDGFDPVDPRTAAWLALGGAVAPGATQALFVYAVRDAGPSRATLISNAFPLFSIGIALIVLREEPRAELLVGAATVVAGAMLLAWERTRPSDFRRLGALLALVCAVLFATRDNLIRHVLREFEAIGSEEVAIALAGAIPVCWLYLLRSSRGRAIGGRLRYAVLPFAPAGFLLFVAYEGLVLALSQDLVSIVAPLVATQSLWAIGFGWLAFGRVREQVGLRLLVAAVLITTGSALIAVFR